MALHSQRKCPQTAQHQVRLEGAQHRAQEDAVAAQLVEQGIFCADGNASRAVPVSANILRRAMRDDIDAMLDRDGPYLARGSADSIEVDYLNERIRDRLDVDDIGLLVANELRDVDTTEIVQHDLDPHRREDLLQQANRRAIEVLRCHNLRSRSESDRYERRVNGSHPRTECDRANTSLSLRQGLFESVRVGIALARVDECWLACGSGALE